MELYLETFDVAKLIDEVASTIQPLVREERATRCAVDVAPDLGAMHADLTKVRQGLFNLLSQRRQVHPATARITVDADARAAWTTASGSCSA